LITFIETPQSTDIIEIRSIAAGAVSISSLTYGPTSKVELSTGNINITGNLLPSANVTYDLGSNSLWWRDLYMSGSTIHIGGALLKVVDNALSFTPAGSATPINLSNDINPSLLYAGNSNVTVTANSINVAVSNSNIASFSSLGLAIAGNISANNFNYTNGVSILDSVTGSLATLTSNAATQSGLITDTNTAITTANTNMKGYVDGQITTVSNSVTGANAAITTANTNMKGYVDAANTIQSNQITTVSSSVTGANAAIVTANTNMNGYVDSIDSTKANLSGATFSGAISATSLTLSTTALAITSGGTGGTSASEALNNLFPSGETSGYVLKTSGPGTYYWAAESGASSTVGTIISTSRTYKTATAGQTVFTGLGTYTPGAGQLRIYINGVRQFDSAYTETNSSAVTLSTGVSSGTVLLAEVDAYTDYNAYANATYSSPVGTISATTVQDALAELDTEKAALSGATFTGNISAGNVTATNLTGTILTAAQTSITSLGTLGALSVTGNITAGNISATNLVGAITSSQVTTALGFTPYNATNPSGYLSTAVTSAVAGTGVSVSAGTGAVTFSIGQAVATSSSVQFGSLGVGTAASGTTGEIRATNNITAYYSSDSHLKENVRDIPDALDKVTAIGGKLFDWTDEYIADHGGLDDYFMRKADFGVIAQDVAQVLPEAVRTREDGYLAVDYEKMCALAFQAIKELQQQVQLLEQQIKGK
jgi:hypothetical protein